MICPVWSWNGYEIRSIMLPLLLLLPFCRCCCCYCCCCFCCCCRYCCCWCYYRTCCSMPSRSTQHPSTTFTSITFDSNLRAWRGFTKSIFAERLLSNGAILIKFCHSNSMVTCDKLWNSCKDSYCLFWEMPKWGKSERRGSVPLRSTQHLLALRSTSFTCCNTTVPTTYPTPQIAPNNEKRSYCSCCIIARAA